MVPRPVLDLPDGSLTRSRPPKGSSHPTRTSPRVPQPVSDLPMGLLTHPNNPRVSNKPSRTP